MAAKTDSGDAPASLLVLHAGAEPDGGDLAPGERHAPIAYEYVWFNGHAVAQIDTPTSTFHYTFTDHLGTPLLLTNADGTTYWRAEYEPFGAVFALRSPDVHPPLRLPGQEAEQLNVGVNGATERDYNIFRWYRSGWGKSKKRRSRDQRDGIVLGRALRFGHLRSRQLRLWQMRAFQRCVLQAVCEGLEEPVQHHGTEQQHVRWSPRAHVRRNEASVLGSGWNEPPFFKY